jgi:hypothetical protein
MLGATRTKVIPPLAPFTQARPLSSSAGRFVPSGCGAILYSGDRSNPVVVPSRAAPQRSASCVWRSIPSIRATGALRRPDLDHGA